MGVVVAAKKPSGERAAIKFLRPKASRDAEAVERFFREARACMAIKGEHVVRVLDVGTTPAGAPYLVMELLQGTDLGRVPRPVAVTDAVDWVLQACVAVAEAHAAGFVHRDLKPSNLFLAESSGA
jgi:serine/threonine-protein kinase